MTNTAPKFFSKLITSTAIAAACISFGSQAMAKDVGDYDVWEFENTKAFEKSKGYVKYKGDKIIDNLTQEDIGRLGHVDIDAKLTVATGAEEGPMHLLGKLTSTGDVYVLDVNGFVFGKDAVIDTNSFAAIAGTVKIDDILDDDGVFTAETAKGAKIVIEEGAMISVADAGLAAFVAPTIQNAGVINARVGKVAFAAGEKVTLDLYGDKLVEIAVDDKLEDALIEHSGVINAQGGTVQISAQAAKQAVDNIINLDGVVNVTSATQQGGKIVLSGGDQGVVNVAGKLNANGTTGGQVDVTGQNVYVAEGAEISADGTGKAGTVRVGGDYQGEGDLDTAEQVYVADGSSISAKSTEDGEGGKVIVWSDKNTWMNGDIDASGAEGKKGGFVETSGKENLSLHGSVDAGDEGEWLLDPTDIRIVDGAGEGDYDPNIFGVFRPRDTGDGIYNVSASSINDALNNDNHVTIQTRAAPLGNGQEGNITVTADITKNSGAGTGILSFDAINKIVVENGVTISATSGQLDVDFVAGNDIFNHGTVTTNGGRVDFVALDNITNNGVITTNGGVVDFDAWHKITNNGTITTNGGNVDFDAGQILEVPVNDDAEINTGVGSSIDAGTGSIDFKSAGTITHGGAVKTTSGYISLDNEKGLVTTADSKIQTTTGDVKLDSDHSVTHGGEIVTNGGKVTLESDRLLDPFSTHVQTEAGSSIRTNGGDVNVHAIGSTGLDGSIETRGGDVTVISIDGGNTINGNINADTGKIGVYTKGIGSGKTIVSDTATLTTTSGDVEILSALDDIEVAGTISSDTGNVKLWTFLNLNLNGGQISGNTVNLRGATIEQDIAGAITATTLTGASATTTTLLGSANDIANLGDFSTGIDLNLFPIFTLYDQGGFTLTNTGDLNVTGAVTSYGGDVDIDTTGALDVVSTGVVDASTGDVDLTSGDNMSITGGSVSGTTVTLVSGGNIVQDAAGTITATTLTGSSKEQTELNGTNNNVAFITNFATGEVSGHEGGFVLNNARTGTTKITGTLSSQGGDIDVATAGRLDANGTVTSNNGNISLASGGNSFLYVRGTVDAGEGDVDLDAGAELNLNNGTVIGDTVNLDGKIIEQNADGTIIANALTGRSTKSTTLNGTANEIQSIGDFETGKVGPVHYDGGFVLNNAYTGELNVTGDVSSQGGDIVITTPGALNVNGASHASVVSNGGDITLTSGGWLYAHSTIDAGTGDVDLDSGATIRFAGDVTGDTVTLTANNNINQAGGSITATTLTGSSNGWTNLGSAANSVQYLDDFSTGTLSNDGGFNLNNGYAGKLEIIGDVTSQGGDIAIITAGALSVNGADDASVVSNGGNITLTSGGWLYAHNTINAGTGDVALDSGATIRLAGDVTGNELTLTAADNINQAGGSITATTLTGSSNGWTNLAGGTNSVQYLDDFSTGTASNMGGFVLDNDYNGTFKIVGDVSSQGGDIEIANSHRLDANGTVVSNGGDISLTSGNNTFMYVRGLVDAGAGDVNLDAAATMNLNNGTVKGNTVDLQGKIITQDSTGTLIATTLTGSSTKSTTLNGAANDVANLDTFTTGTSSYPGGFTLNDSANGLNIIGAVTTQGGNVDVDVVGDLNIANSGLVNANGGNIDLYQTGTFSSVNPETVITSGTGNITLYQNAGGKIQNAIDAFLNTGTGSNTLYVGPGEFKEFVTVDLDLDLLGAQHGVDARGRTGAETIITPVDNTDNGDLLTSLLTVTADGAGSKVDGFTFNAFVPQSGNLNAVVKVNNGANDVVVTNNIFNTDVNPVGPQGNMPRELVVLGDDSTITYNSFTRTTDALDQAGNISYAAIRVTGNNTTIQSNSVDGGPIRVANSTGTILIDDNDVANTRDRHGIEIWGTDGTITISNNDVDGTNNSGIRVTTSSGDLEISGNTVGSATDGVENNGITVNDFDDALITGNTLWGSGSGIGINVVDSDDAQVISNTVNNFGEGIRVNSSDDVKVELNTLNDNKIGVRILNSDGVFVGGPNATASKNIINNGTTGVYASGSNDLTVQNNEITGATNGVIVKGSDASQVTGTLVDGNEVKDFDGKGVALVNTFGAAVTNNLVDNATNTSGGGTGVYVNKSSGTVIGGDDVVDRTTVNNTIQNVENAITIVNSNDILVGQNDISNTGRGIYAGASSDITVKDNVLTTGSGHAIVFSGVTGSIIGGSSTDTNEVTGYNNGIIIRDSNGVDVSWNDIEDVAYDGIRVVGSNGTSLGGTDNVVAKNNEITGFGRHGIYVNDSDYVEVGGLTNTDGNTIDGETVGKYGVTLVDTDNAFVGWNSISNVFKDGVYGLNSNVANIFNNSVSSTYNGIKFINSSNVVMDTNTITDVVDDGIDVEGGSDNSALSNTIERAGEDGIDFESSNDFIISDNIITESGESGIDVFDIVGGTISGNTTNDNGFAGIEITSSSDIDVNGANTATGNEVGIYADTSSNITVEGNTTNVNDIGIYLQDVTDSLITDSITNENTAAGIKLVRVNNVSVRNNSQINENGQYGLWIAEAGSGNVIISGNTFTDNPTGIRAESGLINISSLANPNSIFNTNPLNTPVGLQLDGSDVSLVGNTIGGTVFSGFTTPGSFYVRFEDGTLLEPVTGAPVQIDGLNASYDGFVPVSQGGILTPSDLAFLEARVYDADDSPVNGRGNLFLGQVPATATGAGLSTLDNIEDFFNAFGYPITALAGLNVRIIGLPSVGGPSAAGLNNLAPAAGGANPNDLNNITPAAGGAEGTTTPEDLNNINTEAGGEEVTCWSDAVAGGSVATLTYGGTMEDALETAGSCSNAGAL